MWLRRHWPGAIGAIDLIYHLVRAALDFGGYIDLLLAHLESKEVTWVGRTISFISHPPPWFIIITILLGLLLIYWDTRRITRAKTEEISMNSDQPKAPPPISINNAPGSIIAPSGGNNTILNHFTPPQRTLASEPGRELKEAVLSRIPKDRKIRVTGKYGDDESYQYASEIHEFLKAAGFNTTDDDISDGAFNRPIKGVVVQENKDLSWTVFVGTNQT